MTCWPPRGGCAGCCARMRLVAGELSLPVVLRQIVGAARDLLGARYAALGVLGRDGGLEQFVHAGMDDELVARIGDLPRGPGDLGPADQRAGPDPARRPVSAHPAAAGFPPGHPPMGSFLGVPVRIGEEVFGNLYLTERIRGRGVHRRRRGAGDRARRGRRRGDRERAAVRRIRAAPPLAGRLRRADAAAAVRRSGTAARADRPARRGRRGRGLRRAGRALRRRTR